MLVLNTAPCVCTAWGDPHYVTFDGVKYDFKDDYDYTLVRDCQNSTDLRSFHVMAKISKTLAFTQEVRLDFEGTLYSLLRGGDVRINSVTVTLYTESTRWSQYLQDEIGIKYCHI